MADKTMTVADRPAKIGDTLRVPGTNFESGIKSEEVVMGEQSLGCIDPAVRRYRMGTTTGTTNAIIEHFKTLPGQTMQWQDMEYVSRADGGTILIGE